MLRKLALWTATLLLLAGCGERAPKNMIVYPATQTMLLKDQINQNSQVFSYTHSLALLLPHGGVKKSFEQARGACLGDAALSCKLIAATANSGPAGDEANLTAALPHSKIAIFEKSLTANGGTVLSRATSAENVTAQQSDNDRKVAQLTAWRDRLAALAKRPDISIGDLMKIEAELSKAEADLDAALAEKRDISDRVERELLSVAFNEKETVTAPIARAFTGAGDALIDSTAAAIEFLIRIIPWLPIGAAGIFLIRWLWTMARRKKAA